MMKKLFHKSVAIAIVMMTMISLSCSNERGEVHRNLSRRPYSHADSIIDAAVYSYEWHLPWDVGWDRARVIVDSIAGIIDSLELRGDLSDLGADTWRGLLFHHYTLEEDAHAWFCLALTHDSPDEKRQWYYTTAGYRLATAEYGKHNYEGFLRIGVPILALMDSLGIGEDTEIIDLYSLMGSCYLKLKQPDKAREIAAKARDFGRQVLARDTSGGTCHSFINYYACIKDAYVREKDWESVRDWMAFLDSLGNLFYQRDPDNEVWPIFNAYTHLDRAIKAWSLGLKDSAAAEYAEFRKYGSAYSPNGMIQSNDYLMNAERWEEAADNYEVLDQFINKPYLEEISAYYMPKLRANYYAGRKEAALQVAMQIAEMFDSAYVWQKQGQMAEMATVYETQKKDAEIAQQQLSLSRQRWFSTLAALVLLTAFFIIYTWYRRRAQKRLAVAHSELKSAYDQLEETTAAKERIESELRIARDIQMSMVPNDFPEFEGLDMFAEMNAAKEVGGDLYGYVLQGNQLHFCLGDVSGKGVPASLFMSQSARLFRTLATEGLSPVDIAVRMNNELAENNDRGMFVTMFIGRLHLDTGQLDFCNCGHNPPVLDGQFLKMQYDNQPLGLWEDDPFYGETIDDVRGRQLLVYTDGLNEAENKEQQLLGNQRLLELMADTRSLTSHEVVNKLKDAVEQHRAGAEPNDDLTLMCIRLKK
ncbi:MAG: SpoIIE family protein phosphatase [Bacteroidaceae bacterium]|nr:SpoIIE family protein phosphatase [Bacteroidaceae bacterium]